MGLSLFKRPQPAEPVLPGSVYRRVVAMGVTETARVIAVTTARFNLPHVRFVVQNDLGRARPLEDAAGGEERTLSVDSFQRLFRERVEG